MNEIVSPQALLYFGAIAAFWRQIVSIANRLRAFLVVKATIRGNAAFALRRYAERNWKKMPVADRLIISKPGYAKPLSRMIEVAWDSPSEQPSIYLAGTFPVFIGGKRNEGMMTADTDTLSVSCFRGTVDLDAVIASALSEMNDLSSCGSSRYHVRHIVGVAANRGALAGYNAPRAPTTTDEYAMRFVEKFIGWQTGEIGEPRQEKPMGALVLMPQLQQAAEEFERWLKSKDWFRSKQIPWRRGWLLYGKPGTGKTSFVRALAQHHDLPIYSYDLSTLRNDELIQEWRHMQESAPCIALFEDIDGVFHGRENVLKENSTITFDCLLNCLSGVQAAEGVFVVITTNKLELVDPALGVEDQNGISTRPGRLDRVIEVPLLGLAEKHQIVDRICGEWPEQAQQIKKNIREDATAAQVVEMCVKEAQRLYWGDV